MAFEIVSKQQEVSVERGGSFDIELYLIGGTNIGINRLTVEGDSGVIREKVSEQSSFNYKVNQTTALPYLTPSDDRESSSHIAVRQETTGRDSSTIGNTRTMLMISPMENDLIVSKQAVPQIRNRTETGGEISVQLGNTYFDEQGIDITDADYASQKRVENELLSRSDFSAERLEAVTNPEDVPNWYDGAPLHYHFRVPRDAEPNTYSIQFTLVYTDKDTENNKTKVSSTSVSVRVESVEEEYKTEIQVGGLLMAAVGFMSGTLGVLSPFVAAFSIASLLVVGYIAFYTQVVTRVERLVRSRHYRHREWVSRSGCVRGCRRTGGGRNPGRPLVRNSRRRHSPRPSRGRSLLERKPSAARRPATGPLRASFHSVLAGSGDGRGGLALSESARQGGDAPAAGHAPHVVAAARPSSRYSKYESRSRVW